MKYLILLAGGTGTRTGLEFPKQYYDVKGKMLINFLIENVEDCFDKIVVVMNQHDKSIDVNLSAKTIVAKPGTTRFFSILSGLNKLSYKNDDLVFIHDAARVLLGKEDIAAHVDEHSKSDAVISVGKSIDTMFVVENSIIKKVYKKNQIVRGLTPQSYKGIVLNKDILSKVTEEVDLTEVFTDVQFSTVVEISNLRKVTNKEDLKWIEGEL